MSRSRAALVATAVVLVGAGCSSDATPSMGAAGSSTAGVGGMAGAVTNTPADTAAPTTLGLTVGKVYELALFHADRGPVDSNLKVSFTGFVNNTSQCTKN